MELWKLILGVLGSSVLVEAIKFIAERYKRKDAISDKRNDASSQIEELRAETTEQFSQIDNRFKSVEHKIDTVSSGMNEIKLSTKAQAYDRIRHLGMQYIRAGYIDADDLRAIVDMHQSYKALGGDGFLDKVMDEVYRLRIKS